MQPTSSLAPSYRQESSAHQNQPSNLQAWPPAQGSALPSWPPSPQWQGSQGSTAQPWLGSPKWQAPVGSSRQAWPPSPQWAQSVPAQPLPSHLTHQDQRGAVSDSHLQSGALQSSNGSWTPSYPASQPNPTQEASLHADLINRPAFEQPLSLDAVQGLSDDDDDGFGDFAMASNAASVGGDKQQAAQSAVQRSADRWAESHPTTAAP